MTRAAVIVIGGTGHVGRAVSRQLSRTHEVVATHHTHPGGGTVAFDLATDAPSDLPVRWSEVAAVVLAGGVTALDACAKDPEGTSRVNVDGTLRIARFASEHGANPIFLSSDAVFAGDLGSRGPMPRKESDPREPTTAYGRQKRAVEDALGTGGATILRLSKLSAIDPAEGGFLIDHGARLLRGETLRCATDQFLNLTWVEDVARVVAHLVAQPLLGPWHVAADRVRSRYEWCTRLADALGVESALVTAACMADFDFSEVRPKDCSLDGSALAARLPFLLCSGDELVSRAASALRVGSAK